MIIPPKYPAVVHLCCRYKTGPECAVGSVNIVKNEYLLRTVTVQVGAKKLSHKDRQTIFDAEA